MEHAPPPRPVLAFAGAAAVVFGMSLGLIKLRSCRLSRLLSHTEQHGSSLELEVGGADAARVATARPPRQKTKPPSRRQQGKVPTATNMRAAAGALKNISESSDEEDEPLRNKRAARARAKQFARRTKSTPSRCLGSRWL